MLLLTGRVIIYTNEGLALVFENLAKEIINIFVHFTENDVSYDYVIKI